MLGVEEIRSDNFLSAAETVAEPVTNDLPLLLGDDVFCNESGYVRLNFVQCALGLHRYAHDIVKNDCLIYKKETRLSHCLSVADCDIITEQYVKWRDQREVIPIKYTFVDPAVYASDPCNIPAGASKNAYGVHIWNNEYGLPCSYYNGVLSTYNDRIERVFRATPKRGNDLYCQIVAERFKPALSAENIVFFDPSWGTKQTPMLYITVTVDPRIVGYDIGLSWLLFGKWWNSFITNLRNQYGCEISYIRSWQSQDNFMPHGHALVYFKDRSFTAVQWRDRDGGISFRLPSRSKDRSLIKNAWKWGNCDIQCVADTQTAYKDLLKYVLRDLEGGASDKTNGMVWFFEKRSFAISGNFFDIIKNATSEPDVADLIVADMRNSNSPLVRIDIFPVMGAVLVPVTWQHRLIGADPPPDLLEFFRLLEAKTEPSECKRGRLGVSSCCKVFVWKKPEGFSW